MFQALCLIFLKYNKITKIIIIKYFNFLNTRIIDAHKNNYA